MSDVKRRADRQPQRMTADGLRGVAMAHLQRFPCSVAHLRRVLVQKIRRSVRHYGDDEAPLLAAVETVIAALDGGPLLDDARYAGAVAGSLHRRGVSRRMSAQRLRTKGVASEQIAVAQAEVAGLGADSELVAATRYAQRRRLGPFQPDAGRRVERRLKDLAALGRQGFDYATARRVVDAEDGDALPTGDGEA